MALITEKILLDTYQGTSLIGMHFSDVDGVLVDWNYCNGDGLRVRGPGSATGISWQCRRDGLVSPLRVPQGGHPTLEKIREAETERAKIAAGG